MSQWAPPCGVFGRKGRPFHMGRIHRAVCSIQTHSVQDFAQTVKQQADIVKVIEGYIRLRKAGAQTTPACARSTRKSRLRSACMRCGSSTTALAAGCRATCSALSARLRTSASLRRCGLWRRSAGFRCPSGSFLRRRRRPRRGCGRKLLDLHETAAAWFEEQLRGPEGAVAREYLAGRGMTAEGIAKFRIGYAPDSFNALRDRLSGMADQETLRASGLFSSKEQGDGTRDRSTTGSANG